MTEGTNDGPPAPIGPGPFWRLGVPVLLVLVTLIAFRPTLDAQFLGWDDDGNFTQNDSFGDLNGYGVVWAWTTLRVGVYQPIGWMLYEAQHSLFELRPRGYHVVSQLMHALNVVVLYALVVAVLKRALPREERRDFRAIHGGAAIAVALYAVHPMRVEVVSWTSAQSYMPSALFAMLATLAYLRAHPEESPARRGWVIAAWVLAVVAMLAKAPALSLPGVFLILDIYPLRRLGKGRWNDRGVWLEKLAFVIPAIACALIAMKARGYVEVAQIWANQSIGARLGRPIYAVGLYLGKTVWPVGLSALYPFPNDKGLLDWPFLASAIAEASITVAAVLLRKRWPGLLWAWVATLLILLPTLGVVRIGQQAAADRYTYLAVIPEVLLAAWLFDRVIRAVRGRPAAAFLAYATAAGALVVLSTLTWHHCHNWKTSLQLWTNANNLTDGRNPAIKSSLGIVLIQEGRAKEGMAYLEEGLKSDIERPMTHYNIGVVLVWQERYDDAENHFVEAVNGLSHTSPSLADAHYNLGIVYEHQGRLEDAFTQYARAARMSPRDPAAQNNLGSILLQLGRYPEAAARFSAALRLRPGYPLALHGLNAARRKMASSQASPDGSFTNNR